MVQKKDSSTKRGKHKEVVFLVNKPKLSFTERNIANSRYVKQEIRTSVKVSFQVPITMYTLSFFNGNRVAEIKR